VKGEAGLNRHASWIIFASGEPYLVTTALSGTHPYPARRSALPLALARAANFFGKASSFVHPIISK